MYLGILLQDNSTPPKICRYVDFSNKNEVKEIYGKYRGSRLIK